VNLGENFLPRVGERANHALSLEITSLLGGLEVLIDGVWSWI